MSEEKLSRWQQLQADAKASAPVFAARARERRHERRMIVVAYYAAKEQR